MFCLYFLLIHVKNFEMCFQISQPTSVLKMSWFKLWLLKTKCGKSNLIVHNYFWTATFSDWTMFVLIEFYFKEWNLHFVVLSVIKFTLRMWNVSKWQATVGFTRRLCCGTNTPWMVQDAGSQCRQNVHCSKIIRVGRYPMVTSIVLNSIIKNSEFNAGCEAETVQLTYYLIFFCSLFSWYASLSQAACTAVILAYIFTLPLLRNTYIKWNKKKTT